MAPEGLFMLDSVMEILDIIGLKSAEPDVDFKIYTADELKQAIQDRKCPVINVTHRKHGQVRVLNKNAQIAEQWYVCYLEIVENPCKVHAIVATALIKDGKYLKCKDSYREDPTQIGLEADQIIEIPLDPSDTSSQWNLFYKDKHGNDCIDAFFISLERFWFIYIFDNYMW